MVIAPGEEGVLGILPRHEPVITTLKPGSLEIVRGGERELVAIGGGFLEVRGSEVVVMASAAERAEAIDIARAEAAREQARRRMQEAPERGDLEEAVAALRRAEVRIDVARRMARRPRRGLPVPGQPEEESTGG
jgi:F-type H+-transporting ATPase subunit epsilon